MQCSATAQPEDDYAYGVEWFIDSGFSESEYSPEMSITCTNTTLSTEE